MGFSKSAILGEVTEYEIISHYVPGFNDSILTSNRNILSVFNPQENNPSLSFYQGSKGINFKCHSTGHQGDCFQLVADLKGLDNRSQFDLVLEAIASDLRLNIKSASGHDSDDWKSEYYDKMTKKAIGFWDTFKVDQKTLSYYKVKQLKKLTYKSRTGKMSKYDYESKNLIAFEFDIRGRKKLYVPKQKGLEDKYIAKNQRSTDIFGLQQLTSYKVPYILICEGEKDCLVASAHGIPAVCFQSASIMPTRSDIRNLLKHASYIIVCYDNDEPGQRGASAISEYFGIVKYQLPDGFNDIAEYLPNANADDFKNLLFSEIQDWRKSSNLRIWEQNSGYVKYAQKRNGEETNQRVQVSNFILEVDAMIMTNDRPQRLLRLVGPDHSTSTLSVSNSVFGSEQKFSEFASDQKGNFFFHGTKSDLQEITKRVFHLCDYLDKATKLGYDKSRDLFILANGVFKKGKFLRPNNLGIYDDLIIPTAAKNYDPVDGDNFHIRYESGSKIDASQFLEYMCKAWKREHIGITCFAYLLASLNFDWLSQSKGRNFPMLNIDGQARTGKGSLIKVMMSIFSDSYREISLHNATTNFLTRKLEQMPNIPIWFDEYLNSLSDKTIQAIKNFFDLIGRGRASYTSGNETTSSKILSPVIVTGEESPVNNEALYSRLIVLSLPPLEKSAESIRYFNQMELELSKGVSHILAEMLSWRELIKDNFDSDYLEVLESFQDGLADMKISIDTRIIKNYAKIFTPLYSVSKSALSLDITREKILAKAYQVMADHTISARTVDDVNVFLKHFVSMNSLPFSNANSIKEDYDYIVDMIEGYIYIKPIVFAKAANYHIQIYQRPGKDSSALEKYIRFKPYYKGSGVKKYFKITDTDKRQARSHKLSLTEMPDFFQDFFKRESNIS